MRTQKKEKTVTARQFVSAVNFLLGRDFPVGDIMTVLSHAPEKKQKKKIVK